ncbi:MAG TPA: flagella assembly protein FlgT middle domain-containing protein [Marinagarivorans sp.]
MLALLFNAPPRHKRTLISLLSSTIVLCVFLLLTGCSVFTGKSALDAFIDGDPYPRGKIEQAANSSAQHTALDNAENNKQSTGGLYGYLNEPAQDNTENRADDTEPAPAVEAAPDIVMETSEMRCLAEHNPSFSYRKRVAVLPMELQDRQHAVDMPYVEREYPQVLTQKLNDAGLLAADATAYHRLQAHPSHSRLQAPFTPEQIRDTAADLNSQFLITGRLVDLSFDRTKAHAIDLLTGFKPWKKLARQTYEGATDSYWRQFNVELSVYDGPSGALIKRQRYRGEANHPVTVAQNYGMDTNVFWQSAYGELVDDLLDQQSDMVARALECLPLRAQVSRVDTDVIEINAGVDSRLMPGDRLRIFHREPAGRDPLGVPKHRWKYYGGVTIMGVFPLKSIAILDEDLAPDVIKLGDIVQAW